MPGAASVDWLATVAGVGVGSAAFFVCCGKSAEVVFAQTKAIRINKFRGNGRPENRVNVVPVFLLQAHRASELSLLQHCTRDDAYRAQQKIVSRLQVVPRLLHRRIGSA